MKSLIVIGEGLASLSFLYILNKNSSHVANQIDKIYWISDKNYPVCSLNSTAVLTLRGTTRGNSELGDWLVEGFEAFQNLQKSAQFRSLETGIHYQLWSDDEPKIGQYRKRYTHLVDAKQTPFLKNTQLNCHSEPCFLFEPENFLNELTQEILKNPRIEKINDRVLKVDQEQRKLLLSNQTIHYDFLFSGNGAGEFDYPLLNDDQSLQFTPRPSSGHYLNFYNIELPSESFFVTYQFKHISYRRNLKLLQVSTLSIEEYSKAAAKSQLQILFQEMQQLFSCLDHLQFEHGECLFGVRVKARKKAPYFGRLSSKHYCINGLYKNGYNLVWTLAPKVVDQFLQDLDIQA
jgi:hypothetical protein